MTAAKEKVAYDVEEVRDLLGLGRSSIYEGIRKGEIPSIKIGRRVLVPAWWLRKQSQEPSPGQMA